MDDEADLIARLMTAAGAIMEDAAPVALLSKGGLSLADRIAQVEAAAAQTIVLAQAAEMLRQRANIS